MKICLSVLFLLAAEGVFASQDPEAVRNALVGRLERLKNVSIDYQLTVKIKLSPESEKEKFKKEGAFTSILECGTLTFKNKFSFLEGKKRYDSAIQSISKDGQYHLPLDSSETMTFLEDHAEYLIQGLNPTPTGYIKKELSLQGYGCIEVALGMRTYLWDRWITSKMIKEADVSFEDSGMVVLTWIDEKKRSHIWSINPDLGYALTSYKILSSKNKNVIVEMVMSDFKSVKGLMVPYRMVTKSRNFGTGEIFQEKQFDVTECRINDSRNTSALYHITWPERTVVIDERSKVFFIVENGQLIDTRMRDKQIRKMIRSEILKSMKLSTRPSGKVEPVNPVPAIQKADK